MALQPLNNSSRPPAATPGNSTNFLTYTAAVIGTLATASILRSLYIWTQQRNYERSLEEWRTKPSQPNNSSSQRTGKERKDEATSILTRYNAFRGRPHYFVRIPDTQWEGPISKLNLSCLGLRSLPPFNNPETIYRLDAADNCFSEAISLTQLRHLQVLNLSNSLNGFSPNLESLNELVRVDLSDNKLEQFPQVPSQSNRNFHLKLTGNEIAELPADIFQWSQQHTLDLTDNPLSSQTKQAIMSAAQDSKGPTIIFNVQDYSHKNLQEFPEIDRLRIDFFSIIDLRNNSITTIPEWVLSLPSYVFIDLRGNRLDYESKSAIKKIQRNRIVRNSQEGPEILFHKYYREPDPSAESMIKDRLSLRKFVELMKKQNIRDQTSKPPPQRPESLPQPSNRFEDSSHSPELRDPSSIPRSGSFHSCISTDVELMKQNILHQTSKHPTQRPESLPQPCLLYTSRCV